MRLSRLLPAIPVFLLSIMTSCTKDKIQKPADPALQGIEFTFTDKEITETVIKVGIKPSSDEAIFTYGIIRSEEFDEAETVTSFITEAKRQADEKGKKLGDVLDILCSKSETECRTDTPPATKWTVYAFEVDRSGNTGTVFTHDVESLKGAVPENGYNVEVTGITATGATVTVTPEKDAGPYYFDIVDEETFAKFGNDLSRYVPEFFKQVSESYDIPVEQAVSESLSSGKSSFEYKKLIPQTKYTAFAVTLQTDGKIFGKTYTQEFTTKEREVSGMTIDIEIIETDAISVRAGFTPSDNEATYFYEVWTAGTVESYGSDDKVISAMISSYGSYIKYLLKQGPKEYYRDDLQPETEYYMMAFGYDETNGATTNLFKKKFKTAEKGVSSGISFEFTVSNITMYNADIDITPSDNSVFYMYNTLKKSDYEWYGGTDDGLQNFVNETIELLMQRNPGVSREEIVSRSGGYGNKYFKATSLEPGTDYFIFAVTTDATGKFTEKPQMKAFRTIDAEISTATADGYIDDYYDGTKMAELYPDEFDGCQGYACASVRIEKSEDTRHFYMHIFEGDLSDSAEYSDAVLISNLMTYGEFDPENLDYLLDWDKTYTLVGAGLDADGNFGAVSRHVYKITRENASDPSKYKASQKRFMKRMPR